MRVLLIGSGAREHALAEALAASPLLSGLYAAPGNPGIGGLAELVPIAADDVAGLVGFAREQRIDLVVPGPEAPLVVGLADACLAAGIACAGPTAAAARLEGSKSFTKEICDAASIPTARWEAFTEREAAHAFVRKRGVPIVIKADGLAAGKGVVVAASLEEAEAAIDVLLAPGGTLVIEECLEGEEVSLFAFCDGTEAVLIGAAQDHKRIGEGDTGPNTGGMGAVVPPRGFDRPAQERALDLIVRPALRAMARAGTPFRGVLFAGLMLTAQGPKLIEFNVRFGDPEAQVLLPRLRSDLLAAFAGLARGQLADCAVAFSDEAAIGVVLAGRGYPGQPAAGGAISGLEAAGSVPGVRIYQAATALDARGVLRGAGGRVLTVSAVAPTLAEARDAAYRAIGHIVWSDAVWRRDIGARALGASAQDRTGGVS